MTNLYLMPFDRKKNLTIPEIILEDEALGYYGETNNPKGLATKRDGKGLSGTLEDNIID